MKINVKQILEGIKNTVFVKEQVEKVAEERYSICAGCPSNSKNSLVPKSRPDEHCLECGCNLHLKTRSLASECPLKKWSAVANQKDADAIDDALNETDESIQS